MTHDVMTCCCTSVPYRRGTTYVHSAEGKDTVRYSIAEDKVSSKSGEYVHFHDCQFICSYNHFSALQLLLYWSSLRIPMSRRERG